MISAVEIELALRELIDAHVGISRWEAVKGAAEMLGFRSVRKLVRQRIEWVYAGLDRGASIKLDDARVIES